MPNHVHLLCFPTAPEPAIDLYLARIKQPFSKAVKAELEGVQSPLLQALTVRELPGKYGFRFWQEGAGYGRNLFSNEALIHSVD